MQCFTQCFAALTGAVFDEEYEMGEEVAPLRRYSVEEARVLVENSHHSLDSVSELEMETPPPDIGMKPRYKPMGGLTAAAAPISDLVEDDLDDEFDYFNDLGMEPKVNTPSAALPVTPRESGRFSAAVLISDEEDNLPQGSGGWGALGDS